MHYILTYAPTVGLFGVAYKENLRETGKSFILSGKVRENEFCEVVGSMFASNM